MWQSAAAATTTTTTMGFVPFIPVAMLQRKFYNSD
jgi:hypothetical protein